MFYLAMLMYHFNVAFYLLIYKEFKKKPLGGQSLTVFAVLTLIGAASVADLFLVLTDL